MQSSELKTPNDYRLFNFDFVDANFDDFYRCQIVLKMFLEIDIIDKFNLTVEVTAALSPPVPPCERRQASESRDARLEAVRGKTK